MLKTKGRICIAGCLQTRIQMLGTLPYTDKIASKR